MAALRDSRSGILSLFIAAPRPRDTLVCAMPVIHVLDDDAQTRGALAAQLGRLFPHARVIAGTPAELARVVLRAASRRGAGAPPAEARLHIEDGSIVLTDLAG